MNPDKENLKNEITKILNESWAQEENPILLSHLPVLLSEKGIGNYKEILGGDPLKSFLTETSADNGYKVIEDEEHKALVGIVPFDSNYSFPSRRPNKKRSDISQEEKTKVVIDFIKLLDSLPKEDLDEVTIPTKVLVKLLG